MIDVGDNTDATGFFGKFSSGFDFWKHGAGFEIAFFNIFSNLFSCSFINRLGVWLPKIDIGVRNGCDGNKDVGFDFFGESFGGKIFVDNSIDTP